MNKSSFIFLSIGLNLTLNAISKELSYVEVTELQRIANEEGIETSKELAYFLHLSPEEQEAYINIEGTEAKSARKVFNMKINAQKEAYREGVKQSKNLNNNLRESYERQVREFNAGKLVKNYNEEIYDKADLDY